jgi:acyl-CoA synthetase (AMP-forming)/AMP-acid ligase II/aryl carrier-like protein
MLPLLTVDRLREKSGRQAEEPLFTWIAEDGGESGHLTAGPLLETAGAIAGFLRRECRIEPGERAILAYPPGLDFINAFIGCLEAGVVPVPVYPPSPSRLAVELPLVQGIAQDCGARAVLTEGTYNTAREAACAKQGIDKSSPALPWYSTTEIGPGSWPAAPHQAWLTDLACLLYTSGSTSQPRGVMISHENILHQVTFNAAALGLGPDACAVMWLPHYHAFGLITGILNAAMGNGRLYLMSPFTFIQRPDIWCDTMSRVGATHTCAPDFGYALAVQKTTPEQRVQWNLSTLQKAGSGSEPVRRSTVEAFLEAFSVSGFRREAFCPVYGLTEHTVGISVAGRATFRADRRALERAGVLMPASNGDETFLYGCGKPGRDMVVRIVDPLTFRQAPDGHVGEIWVDSLSKALGYFNQEDQTQAAFRARLAPEENDSREYLRTGDLGALLEGELVITGRLKDLIILQGRNLYPQDIEDAVRGAHSAIQPNGVAAFASTLSSDGSERAQEGAVVVVELSQPPAGAAAAREVADAVHNAALQRMRLPLVAIVVAPIGGIAKTPNGKAKRYACRQAFESGKYALTSEIVWFNAEAPEDTDESDSSHSGPSRTAATLKARIENLRERIPEERFDLLVAALQEVMVALLDSSPGAIDPHESLVAMGVSSLQLVELAGVVVDAVGQPLPLSKLLDLSTLSALAAHLLEVLKLDFVAPEQSLRPIPARGKQLAPTRPMDPATTRIGIIGREQAGAVLADELAGLGYRRVVVWDPGSSVRRVVLSAGGVTLHMEGGAEEEVDELVFACAAGTIAQLLGQAVPDDFERDLAADVEWFQGIAHVWYLSGCFAQGNEGNTGNTGNAGQAVLDARAMAQAFGRAACTPQGHSTRPPIERVRPPLQIGERMAIPQTLGWTVFLSSIFPDQPLVNVGGILHVRGALDTELVTEVTRRVVLRSEGLHVRFTPGNPAPCMYVSAEAPRAVFRDFASNADPEAALAAWAGELVREPFVLWEAPLIRVGIARMSAIHHAVAVAAHHGLVDAQALGATQTLWFEELNRALRGEPAGPVIPASQPELAAREASYLASREIERDAAFWRDCVAALPRVALPAAGPSNDARSIGIDMPLSLCARMARWSAGAGSSPAALYHAATGLCLAEILGGNQVLFDTLITTRTRSSAQDTGTHVNLLPIGFHLDRRQPIAAFLREVQAKVLDYVVHGAFGFERIQPLLTEAHIPHPFSWSINYIERAAQHREGEIRFASEEVYRNCQTISLELVVVADSSAGTSRLHINHRLGDVSAERAEQIGRRFLGLVEGMTGSQDRAIGELIEG